MATADSYGLFWNSDNGDRKYNADSLERWLRKFFTSGVFEGDMQVLASSGMTVQIQIGYCNLFGKVGLFEVVNSITLDAANSRYPRIDTIVVERNDTDRIIYLKKVTGFYSGSNPQPTAPVWDETSGVYQLVLAQIYVGAGVSSITQQNITDKRADSSVCGYITGTVTEMDFSQFVAQFEDYYANFVDESGNEYTTWKTNRNNEYTTWKTNRNNDYAAWKNNKETNFNTWEQNFKDAADAFENGFEQNANEWIAGQEAAQEQWQEDFQGDSEEWKDSFETALTNWYSQMQGQISEDAAVNLQTQINSLKYFYVQDGILYIPNTRASVVDGILVVSTT
jgi:hypothetical protein